MLASLMIVPLAAITIAPPGASEEGCPSPRQVSDGLTARLPGAVLGPTQALEPATLRVTIFDPPGGGIRFQLTNADGETVLYRTLPPPPGHPADCVALAETVALIVDRYLHEVGYEAPPLPPPAAPPAATVTATPREPAGARSSAGAWQIGVSIEDRVGGLDTEGFAAGVSIGTVKTGARLPWGARLGAALTPGINKSFDGPDHVTMHRVPLRLSLFAALPVGRGRFEPGVDVGSELLFVSVAASQPHGSGLHLAPFGGGTLAYALPLARHVYIRALGRGGVGTPYSLLAREGTPVLTTPRAYLEFGVESGVSFP